MEIYEKHNQRAETRPEPIISKKGKYWGAIFLWFGLGILLSGVIGFGLPYILLALVGESGFEGAYTGTLIGSLVILIPLMFIFQFGAMRGKKVTTIVCYILYSAAFGVMLSSSLSFAGVETSLYAFLITGGVMALMGGISVGLGDKINRIALIAMTLMLGGIIISLVTFFFFNETLYWIASFAMLAGVVLIVSVDFARIRNTINSAGDISTPILIYCAFMLYTDFIYIFMRVLQLLAIANRN